MLQQRANHGLYTQPLLLFAPSATPHRFVSEMEFLMRHGSIIAVPPRSLHPGLVQRRIQMMQATPGPMSARQTVVHSIALDARLLGLVAAPFAPGYPAGWASGCVISPDAVQASSPSPPPGQGPEGWKVVLIEHSLRQRIGRTVEPTRIAPRIDDGPGFWSAPSRAHFDRDDRCLVDPDRHHGARADIGAAP